MAATRHATPMNSNAVLILAAALLAAAALPGAAGAQPVDHPAHHHHAPASAPAPSEDAAAGIDHAEQHGRSAAMPSHGAEGAMDHGDMQMQGGSAPPDARDPHAYSAGNTLSGGPYTLGPARSLHLHDESTWGTLRVDRLEAVRTDEHTSGAYEATARIGHDYNRLVIKAEGEASGGRIEESRTEALWSHAVATFWDAQFGVRHDTGPGPGRTWAALGIEGLAPYWFEVDAAAYLGDDGRTGLRLSVEYELLLTQRLVLQPRLEAAVYGKGDPANGIGKGLSSVTAGLRLRYEFSRQFAPYVGVEWAGRFGDTAHLARVAGETTNETRVMAGVRFWF